ncbi:MAG: hypothetical protein SFW66_04710 [Gammaproteobacteria bacterium]|nr:hypothetical protein [Gammaproteobacteria bacterium]
MKSFSQASVNTHDNQLIDQILFRAMQCTTEDEVDHLMNLYETESGEFEYDTFIQALKTEANFFIANAAWMNCLDQLSRDRAKLLWGKLGTLLSVKLSNNSPESLTISDEELIQKIYELNTSVTEKITSLLTEEKDVSMADILNKLTLQQYEEHINHRCSDPLFIHKMTERLWMQLLKCRMIDKIQQCNRLALLEELTIYLNENAFSEFRSLVIALGVDFNIGEKTLKSVCKDEQLSKHILSALHDRQASLALSPRFFKEKNISNSNPVIFPVNKFSI